MEHFLEEIAEILETEVENISMETDFRKEIEDWSSMMGFAILVFLEDDYGVKMNVEEFLKKKTIQDLYDAVNTEA